MKEDLKEILKELTKELKGEDEWKWKLSVERLENGFIIKSTDTDALGETTERTKILEDYGSVDKIYEEDLAAAMTARDLCYEILDFFCMTGNKHDNHRVRISVIEQNKKEEGEEEDD